MAKRITANETRTNPVVRILAAALLSTSVLAGFGQPASATQAQSVCMPRQNVIEQLGKQYSEAPIARGLASSGGMVEVFSSPDGETWTLLLTSPQGISCMMSEGQAWMAVQPVLAGDIS